MSLCYLTTYNVYSCILTIGERPNCLLADEEINKLWSPRTMKYYAAIKKDEVLTYTTTHMNL